MIRGEHGDGSDPWPRPQRRAGRRAGAARSLKITTLTAAVRLDGVPPSARLAFDGATDAACFEAYVERCLVRALRAGDIVIVDNLACHKAAKVARLIAAVGACVRYLPACSPDLNPIERLFS